MYVFDCRLIINHKIIHNYTRCSTHNCTGCSTHICKRCSTHICKRCSTHICKRCSTHICKRCSTHIYKRCITHIEVFTSPLLGPVLDFSACLLLRLSLSHKKSAKLQNSSG